MNEDPQTRRRAARSHAALLAAAILLGAAAIAAGGPELPILSTPMDFELPGTQPMTLQDDLVHSGVCSACHGGYDGVHPPYDRWHPTLMAQATRDPVWHAALAIANQDAQDSGELCIRCHSPGAWLAGRSLPADGSALFDTDFEGVTCHLCHRMVDPVYTSENPSVDQGILNPALLGGSIPTEPHDGSYVIDPFDRRRGPFDLAPFFLHPWLESPFHSESLMCATCHDVSNPLFVRVGGSTPAATDTYVLDDLDDPHPTRAPHDMFPIERTYGEWAQSAFAQGPVEMGGRFGGNQTAVSSCQDCHMPDATGQACALDPPVREDMPPHLFAGANSWVIGAIRDLDQSHALYGPGEESYLSEEEVEDAIARNVDMLERAATLQVSADCGADLLVRVVNQTGHKLPTGYVEGRRMWLNVRFLGARGELVAERGAYDPGTATLSGLDTKVYECRHGLDAAMATATGLPEGSSFHFVLNNEVALDNRIPPRGYTFAGFESVQAAPVGYAYPDGQYWDDTTFAIPTGAASVEVTLYHQTTSREYIEFLRDENATNDRGQIAYDLWEAHGKSAPVAMQRVALGLDCNGNGVADACDVQSGTSHDLDHDGVPDECETRRRLTPKKPLEPR